MPPLNLVILGGGNMARALALGGSRSGVLDPRTVVIVEPDPAKHAAFVQKSIRCHESIDQLAAAESGRLPRDAEVLLAVKPQVLAAAGEQFTRAFHGFEGVVISILAGIPSEKVRSAMGQGSRVIRAMPNTPASISQGATAVAAGAGARPGDDTFAMRLFTGIGPVVVRVPESLMDAVTALSGSGPAYLFYLAEAMTRGGTEAGLPPEVADRLTRQTLAGAAALLAGSHAESPADLRAAVTSKGGTTEAACRLLDQRDVPRAIIDAIAAARDRGRELGSA